MMHSRWPLSSRLLSKALSFLPVILFAVGHSLLVAQTQDGVTYCFAAPAPSPGISIGVGYERGGAGLEFPVPDSNRFNNSFGSGVDQFLVFGEFVIPVGRTPKIAVAGRLSWYGSSIVFLAPMPDILTLIPGEEEPVVHEVQEEISFRMQMIQVELMGRISVDDWYVAGGPIFGYRMVQDYRHSQIFDPRLVENVRPLPEPASLPRFEENGHRLVINDGRDLEQNHVALGAIVVAGYDLSLSRHFSLVPELRLRGDFTSPFPDTKWRVRSAGGTLALRYAL